MAESDELRGRQAAVDTLDFGADQTVDFRPAGEVGVGGERHALLFGPLGELLTLLLQQFKPRLLVHHRLQNNTACFSANRAAIARLQFFIAVAWYSSFNSQP